MVLQGRKRAFKHDFKNRPAVVFVFEGVPFKWRGQCVPHIVHATYGRYATGSAYAPAASFAVGADSTHAQSSGRLRRPYNPAHTFYRKLKFFPLTHQKLQKKISDNSKKNVYNYVWYFYAQFFYSRCVQ